MRYDKMVNCHYELNAANPDIEAGLSEVDLFDAPRRKRYVFSFLWSGRYREIDIPYPVFRIGVWLDRLIRR